MTPGPKATLHRCGLRRRLVLALLCLAALLATPAAGTAQAPAAGVPSTWAARWTVLDSSSAPLGKLAGLQRAPDGGLALEAGRAGGSFQSPTHDMGHGFIALGAAWRAQVAADASLLVQVRRSQDGLTWEPWQTLSPDVTAPDRRPEDLTYSELVFGDGRFVQLKVTLQQVAGTRAPTLQMLRLVAIDPAGKAVSPQLGAAADAASLAAPPVISRAGWGADPSLMTWPPEYAAVKKVVIHHTATGNAYTDPVKVVQTIYYYHAVERGWGDIGYNFLIDREGRIYEGRYGGPGVIGGHAAPYNTGTIGVAILGDYTSSPVPAAALGALESFLAWKCRAHGIDPLGSGSLYGLTLPNIMGHRDCNPTACPGDYAYALIPQVREDVAVRLQAPAVTLRSPAANAAVSGVSRVTWQASGYVSGITVAVDGQVRQTLPASATSWPWNTIAEAEGTHRLRVTVTNTGGQSAYAEVAVRVDNTPPTGSLSNPGAVAGKGVTLTLACQGCTKMQFGSGWRWEGEDLQRQVGRPVTDTAAANGLAVAAQAGVDGRGAWYGPYFCALPAPGDYEASFWLRAGRTDVVSAVARLDVSDGEGSRFLAGPLPVAGTDFATVTRYQPFRMRFRYPDRAATCQGSNPDGLELRTWYQGEADLWLDRVEIFGAPRSFASSAWFALGKAEGRYPVEVRFVDAAGNVSPVYTETVVVDRTPPIWGEPGSAGVVARDAGSGLAAGASYSVLADDGQRWGPWVAVGLALAGDGASGLLPAQPAWAGCCIRLRAQDRAGNAVTSPPLSWPLPGDPAPGYRWWGCGPRVYLPLAKR